MNICEIFFSIQGESVYVGLPCIFVRTSGCNLKCSYCDTKYSTQINYKLSPTQLLSMVCEYKHSGLIEITGGEPLLQDDILDFIDILHKNNFKILLETNGSLDLAKIPEQVIKIVDVKTPSSGHSDSFLISNIKHINLKKDNIKFVISDTNDYEWTKCFIKKHTLFGSNILLSTVFSQISPQTIAEKIIKDGLNVRFQLQLHKYIWPADTRGV